MIKAYYDSKRDVIIMEFAGKINAAEEERFYPEIQKVVPKRKGFSLIADFSQVEKIDLEAKKTIKKTMDFLNQQGVKKILRVIADPEQDIGLGIMSIFHYSKDVTILTFSSRQEAEYHLNQG